MRIITLAYACFIFFTSITFSGAASESRGKMIRGDLVDRAAYYTALMAECSKFDKAQTLADKIRDIGVFFAWIEVKRFQDSSELEGRDGRKNWLALESGRTVYMEFTGVFFASVVKERAFMKNRYIVCEDADEKYSYWGDLLDELGRRLHAGPDWREWAGNNNVFE
jgi:hypothetical protein